MPLVDEGRGVDGSGGGCFPAEDDHHQRSEDYRGKQSPVGVFAEFCSQAVASGGRRCR